MVNAMNSPAPTQSQCPHIQLLDADLYLNGPPRELYRELRQSQPVCWLDDPYTDTGYWAVTCRAEVDFVSKNPRLFSSEEKLPYLHETLPEELDMQRKNLLCMDPPHHVKYRRIVRNAFTPTMVDSYRDKFERRAQEIVAAAVADGHCEFVADIAAELPLIAICDILGVPAKDRRQFFEWSNTMIGFDDPEYSQDKNAQTTAAANLYAYADQLMERMNQDDAPEHNLVSTLLSSNVEGEKLTVDEFRNFMLLLIVAGNETTRNQTSQLMRLLIEHPEQYQLLIDEPERIPDAVEEGLRYASPVIAFRRTAMDDLKLGEHNIAKGDKVVLFYQSASADEAVFSDPDRFDITRPQREPVAGESRPFGYGEHFCLGTHLARLELRVTFAAIVSHIRKPRINGSVEFLRSHFINGIKRMPIAFETV